MLSTRFHKNERGSRFQNGGNELVREGVVVICGYLIKESQHILEKKIH
jgi:hypothetical protein